MSGQTPVSNKSKDDSVLRHVLLVCSRVFREGLTQLLADTTMTFVEGSSTVSEAVAQMEAGNLPDLVIAVVSGDDANNDAFRCIQHARGRFPQTRWLLLTDRVTPERLREAAAAGIDGLLPHEISGRVFVHAAELLLLGQTLLPSALVAAVPAKHADTPLPVAAPAAMAMPQSDPVAARALSVRRPCHLSRREYQILDCLVKGHSNKLIAKQFEIADTTVKVHVKALLRKLQVTNRTQAAILAVSMFEPEQNSTELVEQAVPRKMLPFIASAVRT